MPHTHFPFGVSSYGVPILPGPGVVPQNGNVFFVNADKGSDAYDGRSPLTTGIFGSSTSGIGSGPFKTLDRAYNACTGGLNEVIYVIGGSASINFSSAVGAGGLVWSKNFTHLVGLCNGSAIGQRARISNGATTALYTPMITVSGNGCLFQNLEIFNGGADATLAAVAVLVTGVRNVFRNCQISGGGTATSAGNAAARSLVIGAAGVAADENYFEHCYIGLDTVSHTSTSAEIEILGGSARLVFEDCMISTYGTGSNLFLKVGASGIDRFLHFKRCQFINASTFSGGTALTDAFSMNAAPGGVVLLTGCLFVGATALGSSDAAIFGDNVAGATTTGKGVNLSW